MNRQFPGEALEFVGRVTLICLGSSPGYGFSYVCVVPQTDIHISAFTAGCKTSQSGKTNSGFQVDIIYHF
jgi:hypothetical protein